MIRSSKTLLPIHLLLLGFVAACDGREDPQQDDVAPPADSRLPNVVVVVLDTLRPDHLEAYGYEKETAPFLAELAQRSVLFERAFSTSSWTAPSTASLFTALHPTRHGVTMGLRTQRKAEKAVEQSGSTTLELHAIPQSVKTLPERFKAAGYATFGVASNINIRREIGFTRGFDAFELMHGEPAEALVSKLELFLDEAPSNRPRFLYLHLNDVHAPYEARAPQYVPGEGELADSVARYDSEIRYVDDVLRRMAEEKRWDEDAVWVIVSDHGEEFDDHGGMGHKFSLHFELNRILMIMSAPGLGIAPGRITENVSLIDVLPTLLDLLDIRPESELDGRSLAPLLRGPSEEVSREFRERVVFAHRRRSPGSDRALWAAIQGQHKVIQRGGAQVEMYDLDVDPGETQDIQAEKRRISRRLMKSIQKLRATAVPIADERVQIEIDAELLEHLESLGYAGDEDED